MKARERLAAWVREIGVTDTNVSPNHAWRHTFKRRAARAGIEANIRDGMCGHSFRTVADMYEEVEARGFVNQAELQQVSAGQVLHWTSKQTIKEASWVTFRP